jgi:hypothetical protein
VRCLSPVDVDLALQANRLGCSPAIRYCRPPAAVARHFRLRHDHTRSTAVKLALLTAAHVSQGRDAHFSALYKTSTLRRVALGGGVVAVWLAVSPGTESTAAAR